MSGLLSVRFMFYLVLPSELFGYAHYTEVPNFTGLAIWFMVAYITAEIIICREILKIPYSHGFFDNLADFSNIILLEVFRSWSIPLELGLYEHIYANYRIVTLPHTVWTFLIEVLAIDFFKYWTHRATHEVAILWNMHRIHHSSEHLNLIAAMRACIYQEFVFIPVYCIMAFAIPTQRFFAHMALNTLFTFWTHTQIVPKLGLIEKIFVTASHHRVHHGKNRKYIDTNYGTSLIIWDRLFGTFEEENENFPISFGLVEPFETFNMVAIQWDARSLTNKFNSMSTIGTKAKSIFYGPRWHPGTDRLGNRLEVEENLNPDRKPHYNVKSNYVQKATVLCQFLLTVWSVTQIFQKQNDFWPNWMGLINSFLVLYHFCYLLDNNEKLVAKGDWKNRFLPYTILIPLAYWKILFIPATMVVISAIQISKKWEFKSPVEDVKVTKTDRIDTNHRTHHKFG